MTATAFAQANKLFKEGKVEEAITLYKKATTESNRFYCSHHNLGEALIEAGRIKEAAAAFREALAINPNSAWSLHKLGAMLNKLGQYEEAVGYLRQAVANMTNVPEFYLSLGTALVHLGQWSEAEENLYQVIQFSPNSLPLNEEAKKVHGTSLITFYVSEAYFYLAEIKSRQEQWSEAEGFYRRSWEANPGKLSCCLSWAASLGKLGQWSEAMECYRQNASLFDESGEFLFGFGQALGQLGRWDEAIVEYRKAINLGCAGAEVRHHLGYALGQLGRWDEAVVEYRLVVEINPKSAQVRHQLGYGLMQLGRWREAEIELRKAVELHPGSAVVWQQLGDVLRELGKREEAVEVYQQVVKVQADNHVNSMIPSGFALDSSALLQQAKLAIQNNNWSEAAHCLRQLWKTYGDALPPETMVFISNELFKLDAFSDARNCLERVLAVHSNNLGALREQKNQYCYHVYSSWLMETVEGISDWYRVDGLSTRPDWNTAAQLCRRFLNSDSSKNSPGAIMQYVRTNLLLAEEHLENGDLQSAKTVLQETIETFGKALPLDLINSIVTSVDAIRGNQVKSRAELTTNIQNRIRTANADVLSVSNWLSLYDVLNWNGLFECGLAARQKGIEQAYQQANTQPEKAVNLKIAAMAAIDKADFDAADKYIDKLSATNFNRQELAELRAYKYLQAGDIEGFRQSWPHQPKSVDVSFQKYIQGKSVAVVGPAPTGVADGEEIDSFDVVIRFNYRGLDSLSDTREYGTKTNISLYNAHTIRYLIAHKKLGVLSELDFCLIRRPRHDLDSLGWDKNKIRLIYESNSIFYKSLNSAPAVLFDLLLQGAGKVKLFKSNFYLASQQHSEKYRGRDEGYFAGFPLRKIQPIVANHDLISQISFTRNLWKASLISLDEQSTGVLKLSDKDYLFEMGKLFPNLGVSVQKMGQLETKQRLPSMSMKQVIASAETAMYQKNWGEAINKLKLVLDVYSDRASEKIYILMSRALSAQGNYKEAELRIKEGIAKYPNEIKLFVQLAQIAYDQKDWSEMILCWYQVLIKVEQVQNKKLVENTKKQAYKNLTVAYGNLDQFIECAHFFERFLQTSEIAHQLKPYDENRSNEHYLTTKKDNLKLLALIDDDSSLFTLADAISDFEAHGCQVKIAQVIHKYGKRVSGRQLSLTKIHGREITNIHLSELNKENKFIFEFDALLLCKHSQIFSESFYKLNTTQRPCLLALYPGIDFFPVLGICHRVFADIICLNNKNDLEIYNKILPKTIHKKKRAFSYSPKFRIQSVDSTENTEKKNIKNVYFFAQSIVPFYHKQRLDLLDTLNQCAINNQGINLKIKLRHLPNENKTHSHNEQFSYVELAKNMKMASNVSFSIETMEEVFENADCCITCSSTAGIETAIRGIPTLFYLDFIAVETDPMTKPALKIFQDSGLLCTRDDIINLNLKQANTSWMRSFIPKTKAVEKIIQSIKELRSGIF